MYSTGSGSTGAGRRPSNWAALEALESLTPPSPSPSFGPDGFPSLCSSGEIPIFLDPGLDLNASDFAGMEGEIDEHVSIYLSPGGTRRNWESGIDALTYVNQYNTGQGLQFRPNSDYAASPGHVPQFEEPRSGPHADLSPPEESYFSLSGYLASPSTNEYHSRATGLAHGSPTCSPRITPEDSAATSPMSTPPSTSFLLSPSISETDRSISTDHDMIRGALAGLRYQPSGFSRSTSCLSATLFGSGTLLSPSPSICMTSTDYSPLKPTRDYFGFKKLQKSRSFSPLPTRDTCSRISSPVLQSSVSSSAPTTPGIPIADMRTSSHRRMDSTSTSASARSIRSRRSSHISSPLVSPSLERSQSSYLPGILGWLRNTQIELWIDQGGPRTFRPVFKLMGYTSEPSDDRDLELVNALTYGLADFIPVARQALPLSRNLVGTPPILRRVTIAGDDSKDLISQQASLTTDSDGVYNVCGTELFDLQSSQAPLVLRWKLEYLLHDTPAQTSCIIVDGEKCLTPLKFSCSPGLLHPTHGKKKAKILQVFRKSPSIALFAEKTEQSRSLCHVQDPVNDFVLRLKPSDALYSRMGLKEDHLHGSVPTMSVSGCLGRRELLADQSDLSATPGYGLRRSPKVSLHLAPPSTLTELISVYGDSRLEISDEHHRPRLPYCQN